MQCSGANIAKNPIVMKPMKSLNVKKSFLLLLVMLLLLLWYVRAMQVVASCWQKKRSPTKRRSSRRYYILVRAKATYGTLLFPATKDPGAIFCAS